MGTDKRYYYDCPIKAMYMAKTFGMKLYFGELDADFLGYGIGLIESCEDIEDFINLLCNIKERQYIHPDSLHLLRAEMDDGIETGDCQFFLVAPDGIVKRKPHLNFLTQTEANYAIDEGFAEIIQRNELSFMWPDVENG